MKIMKCKHCDGIGVNYCELCGLPTQDEKIIPRQGIHVKDVNRKKKNNMIIAMFAALFAFGLLIGILLRPGMQTGRPVCIINGNTGNPVDLSLFNYTIYETNDLGNPSYEPLFSGNLSDLTFDQLLDFDHYSYLVINVESIRYGSDFAILNLDETITIYIW